MSLKTKIFRLIRSNYKVIAAVFLVGIVVSYISYQRGFAYDVKVNGQSVGFTRKQAEIEEARTQIDLLVKDYYGDTAFFEDEIESEKVRSKEVLESQALVDAILPNINVSKPAATIYVDEEKAVSLETKESAEKVLADIKAEVIKKMDVKVNDKAVKFSQKVSVKEENVDVNRIYSEDIAHLVLSPNKKDAKPIEVTPVAARSTAEGISLYSDETGDVLKKLAVDVEATIETVETESIAFEKKTEKNPDAYEGITSVKQKGVKGTKEITKSIEYVNGKVVKESITKETVTTKPTDQITLVGTKVRPAPKYNANTGAAIVAEARKYMGIPYRAGGTTPATGFDCSGFTKYVYGKLGYSLGGSVSSQVYAGYTRVSKANLKPGDIVGYTGHVGIYIGNGQMIHSPFAGRTVEINSINNVNGFVTGIRPYN